MACPSCERNLCRTRSPWQRCRAIILRCCHGVRQRAQDLTPPPLSAAAFAEVASSSSRARLRGLAHARAPSVVDTITFRSRRSNLRDYASWDCKGSSPPLVIRQSHAQTYRERRFRKRLVGVEMDRPIALIREGIREQRSKSFNERGSAIEQDSAASGRCRAA